MPSQVPIGISMVALASGDHFILENLEKCHTITNTAKTQMPHRNSTATHKLNVSCWADILIGQSFYRCRVQIRLAPFLFWHLCTFEPAPINYLTRSYQWKTWLGTHHSKKAVTLFIVIWRMFFRRLARKSDIRYLSTSVDRIRRPQDSNFYSSQGMVFRHYFYVIDTKGNLFLESEIYRNIATCLKDPKFLRFFYNQLRPNTNKDSVNGQSFPFISPCGSEKNFVTPEDPLSCIVFTDFNPTTDTLVYGGGSAHKFKPSDLVFSHSTNRIYHRISEHRHLNQHLALLHSDIAQVLSERIDLNIGDGKLTTFNWKGIQHPLTLSK